MIKDQILMLKFLISLKPTLIYKIQTLIFIHL